MSKHPRTYKRDESWPRLTAIVMLRLTEDEKAAYSIAAARQRKKLSEWLRDAASHYLLQQGRAKR